MSAGRFPYGSGFHSDPIAGADALRITALVVRYPDVSEPALSHVDLVVRAGARIALVGPNGAGKSTLLKAVAGLVQPTSGKILIHGNRVGACHHRVAYLPQRGEIDWRFPISVDRFALTGRYVHLGWFRGPGHRDRRIVREYLERLGLGDLRDRQIGELSGGQQQRLLLARSLAQGADLLLLDEPLNAIDAETRDTIHETLRDLQREGKTMLCATHDLGRLSEDFDDAVYLDAGRRVGAADAPYIRRESPWTG